MEQFVISGEVRDVIIGYLKTKPYIEVQQVIPVLMSLPRFEPTPEPPKQPTDKKK